MTEQTLAANINLRDLAITFEEEQKKPKKFSHSLSHPSVIREAIHSLDDVGTKLNTLHQRSQLLQRAFLQFNKDSTISPVSSSSPYASHFLKGDYLHQKGRIIPRGPLSVASHTEEGSPISLHSISTDLSMPPSLPAAYVEMEVKALGQGHGLALGLARGAGLESLPGLYDGSVGLHADDGKLWGCTGDNCRHIEGEQVPLSRGDTLGMLVLRRVGLLVYHHNGRPIACSGHLGLPSGALRVVVGMRSGATELHEVCLHTTPDKWRFNPQTVCMAALEQDLVPSVVLSEIEMLQ
eukprot:gnl/Dysnectes_brevis/1725_a1962_1254.p1 GENE.gnl/Dysnectes_brevis/1725_a1962_1254~~gnl/Dysnectes_brevis/1725_a1962_1254.p1  ORF type:complete len:304 (-),score=82.64 gnl/Dysnectes_brevis/1725_a1962_1254:239-1120(-)